MVHSIIKIENGKFYISNASKYSSFPALVESYMRKPDDNKYYLSEGLLNPKIDKAARSRNSKRDQPESLLWYHGTVGKEVCSVQKILFFLIDLYGH